MNHLDAIGEATKVSWRYGANAEAAIRRYLEARAETDDDHREAGNPFYCEGCSADQLLADFGEER